MEVLSTLSKVLEFTPLGASLHLLDELVQSTLPDYVKSDAAFEQTIDDSVPHALAMFASSDTPVDASTAIKHFTDGMGLDDTQQARIRNTILDNEANVSIVETKIKHLGEHVLTVYRAFSQIIVLSGDFERWQTGNPPTSGVSVQPTRSTSNDNAVSLRQTFSEIIEHSKEHAVLLKELCEDYNSMIIQALEDDSMSVQMIKRRLFMFVKFTEHARGQAGRDNTELDALRFKVRQEAHSMNRTISEARADPYNKLPDLERKVHGLAKDIDEAKDRRDNMNCFTRLAVSTNSLNRMINEIEQRKRQMEIEYGNFYARKAYLEAIQKLLPSLQQAFGAIVEHTVELATFWKSIEEECAAALKCLETGLDKDERDRTVKNALGRKLGGSIYLALGYVMDIYIKQLDGRDWSQLS